MDQGVNVVTFPALHARGGRCRVQGQVNVGSASPDTMDAVGAAATDGLWHFH